MKSSNIKQLFNSGTIDSTITIQGWVKTRRDSKSGISFLHINDGSTITNFQLIVPDTLSNYKDEVLRLTAGCSISATGKLVGYEGKNQSIELHVDSLKVLGFVDSPDTYPIQPKRHTLEFLRDVPHLRPRTNTIAAITRIRHRISMAIHSFLSDDGFVWIHTPIITASDCEGAGELFRVSTLDLENLHKNKDNTIDFSKDFFGKETFLTVSGQLNVEAYCLALSKVYTFGPTFRAENSNTSRHLAEFWMIEPEIAFADLTDVIKLSTDMLQYIIKNVLEHCAEDIEFITKFIDKDTMNRLNLIVDSSCEQMTYDEAITHLEKAKQKFEFPVKWGLDLQSEHERYICEKLTKRLTVITDYPKDIKSFYMRQNEDGKTVAAMDVIAPGIGEIIGGSQREERLEQFDLRLGELNLSKEDFYWYRDLKRYGTVPHGGFGLGLERLLGYVTGIKNVRDLIPFPRVPGSANY